MTPESLRDWYVNKALPIWSQHGVDRKHGAFFELLEHDLSPVERARRARLTARQVFCFTIGSGLGWQGPAKEIAYMGLSFLQRYLIRADGTVRRSVTPEGLPVDDGCDLYDDAFVLFALATIAEIFGPGPVLSDLALHIGSATLSRAGHADGSLRDDPERILSNPLMHLFEACLAWLEVGPDRDGFWHAFAERLAAFAQNTLIARPPQLTETALPEVFNASGRPLEESDGLIIEPGHQFEWGWLLLRWSLLSSKPGAYHDALALGRVGETRGVDPERGVAINALAANLLPRDREAKLWPQTERAKFWHAVLHHPMTGSLLKAEALENRTKALTGLAPFLTDTTPGLWREVQTSSGSFVQEPVRASSLYHIACAALTLAQPYSTRGRYVHV